MQGKEQLKTAWNSWSCAVLQRETRHKYVFCKELRHNSLEQVGGGVPLPCHQCQSQWPRPLPAIRCATAAASRSSAVGKKAFTQDEQGWPNQHYTWTYHFWGGYGHENDWLLYTIRKGISIE